jgi:hypothetical protein
MPTPKITREEPDGPLRLGLKGVSDALGPESGGQVFAQAYDLANGGLNAVLDLHHLHGLGDPDISIPPPLRSVKIERERGKYSGKSAADEPGVARL